MLIKEMEVLNVGSNIFLGKHTVIFLLVNIHGNPLYPLNFSVYMSQSM